jgi:hypothetical protein
MTQQPLLLLDVDGPLNPYAAPQATDPEGFEVHRLLPESWVARNAPRPREEVEPLRVLLNPAHGPQLLALPYDLVWATTWMDEANDLIGPRVGLPRLPYVPWTNLFGEDPDGLHWKTRELVAWADGRPFVWVDDELGPQDIEWIEAHHPAPALPLWIDPRAGLREPHFRALREWAED